MITIVKITMITIVEITMIDHCSMNSGRILNSDNYNLNKVYVTVACYYIVRCEVCILAILLLPLLARHTGT